jgi:uncharacterized protein YgbK (DUF1537 family)
MTGGPVLGVVADDFTGATDVAGMLVAAGLRTLLCIGVPQQGALPDPAADAVVVALKTRTVPAPQAVAESLAAWAWLRGAGARRAYFKICSTFDSTARGNIGPVTEALLQALESDFTIACPAFPENGRTVFRGHLFVADQLLSDSGMRDHPLTPMHDSNLVRVMQAQCRAGTRVGLLRYDRLAAGAEATRQAMQALRQQGVQVAIADALHDADLRVLAEACADLPLVVAGSGLALGLPAAYRARGLASLDPQLAAAWPAGGPAAVLAGSCSLATQAQVARWVQAGRPAHRLMPEALLAGPAQAAAAVQEARAAWAREVMARLRRWHAPGLLDRRRRRELAADASSTSACRLEAGAGIERGASRRWHVQLRGAGRAAPGSSPGARRVAPSFRRSACAALRMGPVDLPRRAVDAGAARAMAARCADLSLALKSGNFGAPDFFAAALRMSAEGRPACGDCRCLAARRGLPRRPLALRARLRACDRGQHQRSAARGDAGFLITPTDACLGFLCSRSGLAHVDASGRAGRWRATSASKTLALHRRIYESRARGAVRDPHAQHAPRRVGAGARTPRRRRGLRDERADTCCRRSRLTS